MENKEAVIDFVKLQTGIKLELCDFFTKVKRMNGKKYFNVVFKTRQEFSKYYPILQRLELSYKCVSFQPNGDCRLAVFF